MARYPSRTYNRRRGRNRRQAYIISILLIIALVIVFVYSYYPFGKNTNGASMPPIDNNDQNDTITFVSPDVVEKEPNFLEIIPSPTAESNPEATELITQAMTFLSAKPSRIIGARDTLNEVLSMPISNEQRAFVKDQLSKLADKWLFNGRIYMQDNLCESYKVKREEILSTIGKQFKVPWEILSEINEVRPEVLPAGETIKIINGPFHARIYLSTFTLDLYLQNTFVRSFRVGLGKADSETPMGLWRVKEGGKLIKPPWPDPVTRKLIHHGEPGYALGSRWIGLEGIKGNAKGRTGFGIHGTEEPETIGTKSSRGCIRLHNGDVILLYNLLVPTFSRVEVVE